MATNFRACDLAPGSDMMSSMDHAGLAQQRPRDTHSSARPRLLLHIGAQKTGSSALQVAFAINREQLLKWHINYPIAKNDCVVLNRGVDSGNGLPLALFLLPEIARGRRDLDGELGQALAALDDAQTVMYSSEFLYRFDPARLDILQDRLSDMGVDLAVIMYVRNLSGHALSMYGQMVKRGLYTGTFLHYLDPSKDGLYDPHFLPPIQHLTSRMEAEDVFVIHYDSVRHNLFAHWCSIVLGLDSVEGFDPVRDEINRSLTPSETRLMRAINAKVSKRAHARLISDALISSPRLGADDRSLTPEALTLLRERFSETVDDINHFKPLGGNLEIISKDTSIVKVAHEDQPLTGSEQVLVQLIANLYT